MTPRQSPTDTTPPPLPPGVEPLGARDPRRVGPFRAVGRLGSGGMGVVYAALHFSTYVDGEVEEATVEDMARSMTTTYGFGEPVDIHIPSEEEISPDRPEI